MKPIYTFLLIVGMAGKIFSQCPIITKQPVSQTDCDGNSIRLIVESNASNVQWEKKRPSDAGFSAISGATTSNYQIMPTGGTNYPDGTKFRAKLQLGSCTVYSDEATINLSSVINITGTSICERSNGELLANISTGGQGKALNYQWSTSINGGPYQDISNGADFDGAASQKLILKNASLKNQSQKFKVKVEFQISPNNDNEGSLTNQNQTPSCPRTSSEVSITIKTSPIPTHSVTTYNACAGTNITVSSTGCSPYTTKWYNSNSENIGDGARPSLLFLQAGNQHIQATCLKNGCESLPSNGVNVVVNEIPSKVSNNGTASSVEQGADVTFKATGGINNIWYLKETDTSPISTASTLTINNVQTDGTNPYYLSRWVSQRINGCEGSKTEIRVLVNDPNNVKTNLSPSTDPTPINNPTKEVNNPIIIPDPVVQIEVPITDTLLTVENPPAEPILIDAPIIETAPIPQKLEIWFSKDCEKQVYVVSGRNCPESIDYLHSETGQLLENVPAGHSFSFDGSINQKIIARCNAPNFEENFIQVDAFKKATVKMDVVNKNLLCEGDSMRIIPIALDDSRFLRWEKDGHIFSETKDLNVKADSTIYMAVYQLNDCQFRIPSPEVVIHPNPQKPSIKYPKTTFCPGETLEITSTDPAHKYHWTTASEHPKVFINSSTKIALKTENEFGCLSKLSDSVTFIQLSKGETPKLISRQLQFCEGDTLTISSTLGENTIWNNGYQGAEQKTTKSGDWFAVSKSKEGCLSDTSDILSVKTRKRPFIPRIEFPFNRILRGVKMDSGDSLIWKLNDDKYVFNENQIYLDKPSQVKLRSMKKYIIEGNQILECFSNYSEQMINQLEPLADLEVFPNPSTDRKISIKTSIPFEHGNVRIIDMKGEILYSRSIQNLDNSLNVQFENLIAGMYLIQIDNGKWTSQKRLLIVD